ncbi:MAG: LamG domain-containing protein, partial [Pseudomonadales bacterium]|nr:LamG domain-containing protein [Pseudomonadales bacterium]
RGEGRIIPGPIGHWRLEEESWDGDAGEVEDLSGNGLHATAFNAPVTDDLGPAREGSPGTCRYGEFDGNNQYLQVNDTGLLDIADALTVSIWINSDVIPGSGLKSIVSKDENFEFHLTGSREINWWWQDSGGTTREFNTSGANIQTGTWYHIAITYRSGEQVIYVNGVALGSASYTGSLRTNSDPLHIGQDQNYAGRYFDGRLDEVRIYSAFLPADVIQDIYQETFPCDLSGSCDAVFPDGIASHGPGTISFGYNAAIVGNSDDELQSSSISHNGGSSVNSCGGSNCQATGDPSLAIDPGSFPDTSANTEDLTIPSSGTGTAGSGTNAYDNITINSQGTLSFSSGHSQYYIDSLSVGWNGQVNLPAGEYWINQLSMSSSARLQVSGSGTVILYVNQSFSLGSSATINTPSSDTTSDPGKMVVYAYGDVTLNNQAWVTGALYSQGNVNLGSASYVHGAVAANTVGLGSQSSVYYNSIVTTSDMGGFCAEEELDHFRITHAGTGLNCEAEPITIAAYDSSGAVVTSFDGTITLSTSTGNGDWLTDGNESGTLNGSSDDSGNATYMFAAADQGSVVLLLKNTHSETVNIDVDAAGTSEHVDYDDNLVFAETGFRFLANDNPNAISTQIANKNFASAPGEQDIKIEAIRTSDESGACEAFLTGSQDIEFAFECRQPTTCSSGGFDMTINGQAISENSANNVSSYQTVTGLDFGDDGENQATISVNYPDAGRVRLHARLQLEDESGTATETISGSSNEFVVRPAGFCVKATESNSDCTAPSFSDCTVFKKAGGNFFASFQAVGWETAGENDSAFCSGNEVLPNFQLTGVPIAPVLPSGHGGVVGNISIPQVDFMPGTNGDVTLTQRYDEVGAMQLTLGSGVISYLGTTISTSTSDTIGRFIPDRFSVEMLDPGTLEASCNGFSYIGENIRYEVVPELRITPWAAAPDNSVTTNYTISNADNDFRKLQVSDIVRSFSGQDSSQTGTDGVTLLSVSNTFTSASISSALNGVMQYTFGLNDSFTYNHDSSSQVAPFTANIDLSVISLQDSDLVSAESLPVTISPAGHPLRYGRWRAENAFGSDLMDLPMLARVEYWSGSQFLVNELDNCTNITGLMSTNPDVDPDFIDIPIGTGSSDVLFNAILSAGDASLSMTAPGAGNEGQIQLSFDLLSVPWLQFDWDQDGSPNTSLSVKATFGRFRGHDRIIYWKEVLE